MKTSTLNPKLAKIRTSWRAFAAIATAMVAGGVLATPSAMAANTYFGTNNVAGTGYDQNGAYWGTSTAETGGSAIVTGDQWTFGINAVDFGAVNGFAAGPYAYTVNLDNAGSDSPGTIAINATNLALTFSGTANTHFGGAVTIVVTNYSTLIWTANNGNGSFNWNGEAATFLGPGTNIFEDQICGANNKAALATQGAQAGGAANNGTMILNQTIGVPPNYHLSGGYVLYSGTLIFANATACADAFGSFSSGKLFQIGWGTGVGNPNPIIDNTSGSAQTLSLGSGTYSLAGDFTFQGSSSLSFGTYGVALTGTPRQITVNNNVLAIGGVISGSGDGINKLGAGTLQLSGANTYNGATLVLAGTLQLTNSGAIAGSLMVSNATFDLSGLASPAITLPSLSLSNSPTLVVSEPNGSVTNIIATTLNVDGTPVTVNFNALPPITQYPTIFPIVKGTTVSGTLNFTLGTLPPSGGNAYQGYVTNIAASGLAELVLTNGPAPVFSVTWSGKNGGTASGTWDVQNTPDWVLSGSSIVFNQGDVVTFNDLSNGGSNVVNMAQAVQPSTLTVSNNATPYTFTGGNLGNNSPGTLTLTKKGPGTLTLQESSDNFSGGINVIGGTVVVDNNSGNITGGTTIASGATVQLGNNDVNDQLPQGGVAVNGSLVFNCADNLTTVQDALTGTGMVMQVSTNTVLLNDSSSPSSGNWSTVITNGTLQASDNSALGSLPGGTVTITNGGTFDLAGQNQNIANFGTKEFIVSGAGVNGGGAIINSSANTQENAFQNIVLTNNATVGGPNRWDMRNGTPVLNLNGYILTVTNINTLALVSAMVTSGNIIVQNGGNFDIELTCNVTNPGTITVESGGTLGLFESSLGSITRNVVLNGGGLTNISSANETAYLNSPVLLQQNAAMGNLNVGDITFYDGAISDGGNGLGLMVGGQSTNYLSGTNTYSGATVINGVMLGLNNLGSINNSSEIIVTNSAVFDLSHSSLPFSGTNTLVLGDDNNGQGTLNLSTTIITNFNSLSLVNPILNMAVPNPGNPCITVTNLYLGDGQGGTINITALPAVLSSMQFPLIKYVNETGSYNLGSLGLPSGYSGNIVNDTANHSIDLQITQLPPGIWNGGGSPDNYWDDAVNWSGTALSGNDALVFSGSVGLNNTNDETSETASSITFVSGAGAFILNPSNNVSLTLGGNIVNDSTATETINIPMSFGAAEAFNGASGPLDIDGGATNTATGNNILTLAGSGTLVDLLNSANSTSSNSLCETGASANWTIMDNPGSAAIIAPWALEITNGTLNFGTVSSAPNFTSTTVHNLPSDSQLGTGSGYSTLNVVNGTLALNTLNTGQALNTTDTVAVAGGTLSLGPIGAVVSDYFQGANGANTGEVSVVTISGNGIMTCGGAGAFWVASRGGGIVTITNSGSLTTGTFDVSRNAQGNTFSSIGVVNLSGGAITCSHVGTADSAAQAGPPTSGPTPSATFNFNGGILRAATNSTTFYQGNLASPAIPIASYVLAGGAFLDTSNWAVTVLEPLQSGASPDGGLTVLGAGTLTLARTNTYNGPTTIASGTLALTAPTGNGLTGTGTITIAGGAAFNVSGLASGFTLASGQILSNSTSTAIISGNLNASAGKLGLTYAAGTPSLSITNGQLTLALGTVLNINNTGTPLAAGVYPIITNNGIGTVGGTAPSSVTVGGSGVSGSLPTSLQISGGVLDLVVGSLAKPADFTGISVNGATLTITATNGADSGRFVLLESTNLLLPINQWTPILTNNFNGSGNLNLSTNIVSPGSPAEFYLLQMP